MTTTKKVLIVAVTVAVLGGIGYWAYKYYDKKSSDEGSSGNEAKPVDNPPVPTEIGNTNADIVSDSTTTPRGDVAVGRDLTRPTTTPTALTNTDINFIVRVFQNWMDKYHPNWLKLSNGTYTNLDQSTSLGYGKLGPQTKTNLKKYKDEFSRFLMSITLFGEKPNRDAIRQFLKYVSQFGI